MSIIPTIFRSKNEHLLDVLFEKVETLLDFRSFLRKHATLIQSYREYEHTLTQDTSKAFHTNGFCYCCQKQQPLKVDYLYSRTVQGVEMPNWREWMVCPTCGLNNRMRAAYHFVTSQCSGKTPQIYLSEQATHLYKQFKQRFPSLVGSEFLGDNFQPGYVNPQKLRHEDATQLTLEGDSCDLYLSFDVFEHIPDYLSALKEAFRVLKPKGKLIFTVPFNAGNEEHLVRAEVRADGSIHYLLPKEIHGDPVRSEGALCYYHFGWQLLRELEGVGFKAPGAYFYLSQQYGYLGGPSMIFGAEK